MMLTHEDLQELKRPFPVSAHEWKREFCYVAEAAVMDRIQSVDPCASVRIVASILRPDDVETFAKTIVRLTIKGVIFDGVGMQTYNTKKDGSRMPTELEKGAATDALRRAARLAGVGRYLLDIPANVTKDTLAAWLKTLTNSQRPTASAPSATGASWLDNGGQEKTLAWLTGRGLNWKTAAYLLGVTEADIPTRFDSGKAFCEAIVAAQKAQS